jgi:hypothetical protein
MKLHLSGVKVPKLGSLHDRVYREYMTRESQLEAEKMKLVMMQTITNPSFDDSGRARQWTENVKKVWTNYLSLQYGLEISEHNEKELHMLDYYSGVIKHLKPTYQKTAKGIVVKGLDILKH